MRKPSTTFKWVDQVGSTTDVPVLEVRPLFLTASSFDKGPEEPIRVYGNDFYKLFGQHISFARHGQPAIQAANIIDNGGELFIKRVVAKDALLAHLILTATVSQDQAQKIDALTGKPLYLDGSGKETIITAGEDGSPYDKVMINRAVIKYGTQYITAKTVDEIRTYAKSLSSVSVSGVTATDVIEVNLELIQGATAPKRGDAVNGTGLSDDSATVGSAAVGGSNVESDDIANEFLPIGTTIQDVNGKFFTVAEGNIVNEIPTENVEYTFPLFFIADNGRGLSDKTFNITCNYALSKNSGFAMYELNYLGDSNFDAESIRFSIDTDKIYANTSYSLAMATKSAKQLKAEEIPEATEEFLETISNITGIAIDTLINHDVLFGCDVKKNTLAQIHVYGTEPDEEGAILLNADYGLKLMGGTNGNFGKAPVNSISWESELVEFFNGTYDDVIFDKDRNKIEVCLDANYPKAVKDAIATLANYREDFVFFRDYGLNNTSWDTIKLQCDLVESPYKTKLCKEYCTSYDIIDKFTRKQISVTMMYSIARLLVKHLNGNRTAPFMGVLYGITIPEAIEGTINFIPKETPAVDQKDLLVQNHINYASMINGVLTIETDMTAQIAETACSYGNNILTVQNTIRKVRTLCPKLRGSFIDSSDSLDKYAQKVRDVITQDKDNYNSIEFKYTADEVMKANHVFDASIYVVFKNYVGSEEFTIYTLDQ